MLRGLFDMDSSLAGLLLRLTLAVVMFPHGAQRARGWLGGQGFVPTLVFFTRAGTPPVLALLVIVTAFLGPLGLALGLLTRVVAFGLLCEMLVAIVTVHWPHGCFMHGTGTQQGEGGESHLLVIDMALTLRMVGVGAWSLDRVLAGRTPRSRTQN